jgi:hypothetical protein
MTAAAPATRQVLVSSWVAQMIGTLVLCGVVTILVKNVDVAFAAGDPQWKRYAMAGILLGAAPALAYLRWFKQILDQDVRLERHAGSGGARAAAQEPHRRRRAVRDPDGDGRSAAFLRRRDALVPRRHLRDHRAAPVLPALQPETLSMYRALAILMAIIQFSFAFHAMKTGRGAKWIMIIVLAPVIGCLLYYFLEVFPHSREERTLRRRIHDIAKTLNPDGELKRRTEEAATTASVDNRARLADECLEKGMFDEAVRLYEGCLEGPHANDPRILFSCARAHFYNGNHRQSEEILVRLEKAHPKFRRDEALLLHARVLDALGDTNGALATYEGLRDRYVGFEAKYRYGVLLKRMGREADAQQLFEFIGANSRRTAIESEREWVRLAARERSAQAT